jgi:ceramide synthetase
MGPHKEWPKLDHFLTVTTILWSFGICFKLFLLGGIETLSMFGVYMAGTVAFIQSFKMFCRAISPYCVTKRNAEKPRNIRKFADQGWQLGVHTLMTVVELWILSNHDWSWYTNISSDGPGEVWEPIDQRQDTLLNAFYLVQLSIWISTAISHRFFEARHKDYFVMYAHHVATITLIGWSWSVGALRIGFIVLLIHDSSDILVDAVKTANYAGYDENSGTYIVEVLFFLNLISWFCIRLVVYPFTVVDSALNDHMQIMGDSESTAWWISLQGCIALLAFLVILHAWWFFLLVRIGYRLAMASESSKTVAQEEYEGNSSESEVEEEDAPAGTKTKKRTKKTM